MNTIIHDPTRGWLLLTPDGQIEIAKEDLKDIVILGLWDEAEDHHPYSVDAEFEVVEQWSLKGENDWYSDEDDRFDLHHPDDCDYRQIARLVKAKEERLVPEKELFIGDDEKYKLEIFKKVEIIPSDSVTSDGSKAKEYKCLECGAEINEGESKTFGVCDECWDKAHPKLQPTESQDELFDIVRLRLWQIGELVPVQRDKEYKKLQSEFMIERI